MNRSIQRLRISLATVAVAGTFAVGLGGTAAWGSVVSTNSPNSLLGVLNSNASPEDALPLDGDRPFGEGMGLIYGSSRLLGESKAAKFWAISDENSDVCLAVLLKQTPGMAFSCVTADNFSTSGVKALLMAGGEYVEAYLVPDSLSLAKSVTGLEQVAPNLVAGDSRGQRAAIVFDTAKAITGGTVELEMSLLHPDDAG